MADHDKHIDEKIKERALKRTELAELGEEIAASAKPIVVAFIDLADSTAMKEDRRPEEWLGSVYEFLIRFGELVRISGGVVVKRIGDEVMATFTTVVEAENFIDSVSTDKTLRAYRYKIALDFGDAYHFRFIEDREDDPYGTVVDRCARIAKLGTAGTIVCSCTYHKQLPENKATSYIAMGDFPLKGLKNLCSVYLRSLSEIDPISYLEPLLASVNSKRPALDGFTSVGRRLKPNDIREPFPGRARPYIARELLNLPRYPHSIDTFFMDKEKALRKEDFDASFLGYVVEWEMFFNSYSIDSDTISIYAWAAEDFHLNVVLILPLFGLEIVKLLTANQRIKIRGVLQSVYNGTPRINYVEIESIAT